MLKQAILAMLEGRPYKHGRYRTLRYAQKWVVEYSGGAIAHTDRASGFTNPNYDFRIMVEYAAPDIVLENSNKLWTHGKLGSKLCQRWKA